MNKFLKIFLITVLLLVALAFVGMLSLGISPIGLGMHDSIYQADGVALGGYDPVAYFDEGSPAKGNAEFSFEHAGATWQFTNQVHLDAFQQNPDRYMPAAGGHCAFAVSTGIAAPCDGEYFQIVNDELYLLSNPEVVEEFEKDPEGMAARVKENWQ